MELAKRIDLIQPSLTIQISMKAKEMAAQGIDVISLSTGEPDFITPQPICDAGIQAIEAGQTHYTAVHGTSELREAITLKLKRDNNLTYTPEQIIASSGAKHSIFNALATLINPKDEVIVPIPYWVSYPEMVKLTEGQPILCQPGNGKKCLASDLEACITEQTKLIILNSPNNPGGYTYTLQELKDIGNMLIKYPNIFILSDDIYEYLTWTDEPFCNIIMACPALKERTLIIHGVSKGHAMTGWRIGFAAGHPEWINAMKKYQSQTTSCPSSIAQAAATQAMLTPKKQLLAMYETYLQRHHLFVSALSHIEGIDAQPSQGSFYSFPNCKELITQKGLNNDIELAQQLLEQAHIAVVPGTGFGAPNHIRMSFASSEDRLLEAVARLEKYAKK